MTHISLENLLDLMPPGTTVSVTVTLGSGTSDRSDVPETPVEAPTALSPEDHYKVRKVARTVGVSERSIRQAIKDEQLPFVEKPGGRDAGAHMVRPADVADLFARPGYDVGMMAPESLAVAA